MQNASIIRFLHSAISEVITETIHERPNNFSAKSIYNRQMSYMSGMMTCRSTVNGVSLGDRLSRLTIEDLQLVTNENTDSLHENTKGLFKAISTSCKAMGHTDKAAKYARHSCFAMLDHYGLNSLFLTTTPDNECSFRVRLYAKPGDWVSTIFNFLFEHLYFRPQCKLFRT
jgi:hypothetical protein